MIVDTKHGSFEIKDITRKQRREYYKKVKKTGISNDLELLHDLGDDFTLLAFGDEKKADEALKNLTVVEEEEVLVAIIGAYMGIDLGNLTGGWELVFGFAIMVFQTLGTPSQAHLGRQLFLKKSNTEMN